MRKIAFEDTCISASRMFINNDALGKFRKNLIMLALALDLFTVYSLKLQSWSQK